MSNTKTLFLAVLMILLPFGAQATLFSGATVQLSYYNPNTSSLYRGPWTALVDSGVEFTNVLDCIGGGDCVDVDVSDTNLRVTMHYSGIPPNTGEFSGGSFNGIMLYDLNGTIPAFNSVTINAATNMNGFDASRISFDGDHIWVNFANLVGTSSTVVSLDVGAAAPGVPEPATVLLVGLGVVGLLVLRRRR